MKIPWRLVAILGLAFFALVISLPKDVRFELPFGEGFIVTVSSPTLDWQLGNRRIYRDLNIKQGLDLQGGTQLVLLADMSEIESGDVDNALESVREIIARRVDLYGVSEPVVQTSEVGEERRVLVELPGIEDVDSAIALVGQTAQLDFREIPDEMREATPGSVPVFLYQRTGLTGRDLARSRVEYGNGQSGIGSAPVVVMQFTDEGREKFAAITERNVGEQVAIFIDDFPVTAPVVQDVITGGEAVISGDFDVDSAKALSIQLNAGALPVPVKVIEQRTIGPSLGALSVQKSVVAGLVGLLVVMGFMWAYYGRMGLIADLALLIYGLITLALYKLIPVTLTLPGIAGFILSVGMAVDANILIFERMREEMRQGRPWRAAMELGFGRAWDSIKDANIATILTAVILLNPLSFQWLVTSGMVRGFALTLLIGVLISMFTGVVVTRTLMRAFYRGRET